MLIFLLTKRPKLISKVGISTLKNEKSLQSANLLSNDNKVNLEVKEPRHPISESLSESQQYNIPSNEEKALNRQNFVTLVNIPEEEQIKIIKTGFQLQADKKISLKKYYETLINIVYSS